MLLDNVSNKDTGPEERLSALVRGALKGLYPFLCEDMDSEERLPALARGALKGLYLFFFV